MSRPLWFLLPLATVAALAGAAVVRAEEMGTIGPTYTIEEPHLLKAIEHPKPLPGITRTKTARSFYFDPSIVVGETITDAKGNILVPAGTRQNPLEVVSLSKHLLFFDGTDSRQVEWARQLIARDEGKVKPILVAGSYLALMARWQLPVYFDQQGALTRKLGITHVPALVSQEGLQLRIDEITP